MKTPGSKSNEAWDALVRQARADTAPSVDVPAVLRAVRAADVPSDAGWLSEFTGLFTIGRVVPACLLGAIALAGATSWEAWNIWQALPWAQLLAVSTGGAS